MKYQVIYADPPWQYRNYGYLHFGLAGHRVTGGNRCCICPPFVQRLGLCLDLAGSLVADYTFPHFRPNVGRSAMGADTIYIGCVFPYPFWRIPIEVSYV